MMLWSNFCVKEARSVIPFLREFHYPFHFIMITLLKISISIAFFNYGSIKVSQKQEMLIGFVVFIYDAITTLKVIRYKAFIRIV